MRWASFVKLKKKRLYENIKADRLCHNFVMKHCFTAWKSSVSWIQWNRRAVNESSFSLSAVPELTMSKVLPTDERPASRCKQERLHRDMPATDQSTNKDIIIPSENLMKPHSALLHARPSTVLSTNLAQSCPQSFLGHVLEPKSKSSEQYRSRYLVRRIDKLLKMLQKDQTICEWIFPPGHRG